MDNNDKSEEDIILPGKLPMIEVEFIEERKMEKKKIKSMDTIEKEKQNLNISKKQSIGILIEIDGKKINTQLKTEGFNKSDMKDNLALLGAIENLKIIVQEKLESSN